MAMTPQEKQRLDTLEKLVGTLVRVENVPFIESINRRANSNVKTDGETSAASITQSVRNAADTGSVDVTKVPDTKLKIVTATGQVLYLPAFNS